MTSDVAGSSGAIAETFAAGAADVFEKNVTFHVKYVRPLYEVINCATLLL